MRAELHIERCLRVLARHEHRPVSWRWSAHRDHLALELDGNLRLRFSPKAERSWFATPSLAVALQGTPSAEQRSLLDNLRTLLMRTSAQELEWELPQPPPSIGPDAAVQPTVDEAFTERLAERLHWASFMAFQAAITEDLYPAVTHLGVPAGLDELVDAWRHTGEAIRSGRAPRKLGLYVHVPFCTVACTFCYCSKTDEFQRHTVERYVDRLLEESALFSEPLAGIDITSVYFGGGTPSLLTPKAMRRMFAGLYEHWSVPAGTQVIYEGNPDSLSERKIEVLASEGRVTRLTIGVQTLDDEVQRLVRRHNKPEHVADAIRHAREHGIPHVNCDLMAGLPGQTVASFERDVAFLLSCEPDSIHLNAYRPLPSVLLAKGGEPPEELALRQEMLERAEGMLREHGHAAALGQGRRKTASAANLQEYDLRRQNSSLVGLGVPARSHAFGQAFYLPEFSGFDPVRQDQPLTERRWRALWGDEVEEQHKYLVSNLRTGFSRQEFRDLFGEDVLERHGERLDILQRLGRVVVDEEEVHTFTRNHVDDMVHRSLLYSPAVEARFREVWGDRYDPDEDYVSALGTLIAD